MGHLFLACSDEIALIIGFERLEEGRDVDDVGVGGDRESIGDFCSDEDAAIVFLQMFLFGLHAVLVEFVFELSSQGRGGKAADSGSCECCGFEEGTSGDVCVVWFKWTSGFDVACAHDLVLLCELRKVVCWCLAEEVRGLSLLDGVRVEESFWICL